jgi:hypothetical protein
MWILPDGRDGVLAQQGGGRMGYCLRLKKGKPGFSVRTNPNEVVSAEAQRPLDEGWASSGRRAHSRAKRFGSLLLMDTLAAETVGRGLYFGPAQRPAYNWAPQPVLESRPDGKNTPYTGMLDQFAVYKKALTGS